MNDDLSGQVDVLAQEQQDEGIAALLGQRRSEAVVGAFGLPGLFQLTDLLAQCFLTRCWTLRRGCVRGHILLTQSGRAFYG